MFRFTIEKQSAFLLALLMTLVLFGCGDETSGTNFGSDDMSEISSDSDDFYITITEIKSSSSSANVYCVDIGGHQLNCDNVQFNGRVLSSSSISQVSTPDSPKGYFVDSRNNRLYKTVKLGSQIWFAENINEDGVEYFDAVAASFACPPGAHLPTADEWAHMMENYSKGIVEENGVYYGYVGKMLKSTESWTGRDVGSNELLFDAKAMGYMLDNDYYFVGNQAKFWTSSRFAPDSVKSILITANDHYSAIISQYDAYKLTVRCVKDDIMAEYLPKEGV